MGNEISYAPNFSWPDNSGSDLRLAPVGSQSLQMDPADVFNYIQQNRQRIGLSDQFQAYPDGDMYVVRMGRADVQHLMDTMATFANSYMQMAQRNPQLLDSINGQSHRWPTNINANEGGCPCGGGCQCGIQRGRNRANIGYTDSSNQPTDYSYQQVNGPYIPNQTYGYNGYGYGRNNGFGYGGGGYGGYGGNPIMQSLAYGGGNPGQNILRYGLPNLVSGLVFSGLSGGGFGRFRH